MKPNPTVRLPQQPNTHFPEFLLFKQSKQLFNWAHGSDVFVSDAAMKHGHPLYAFIVLMPGASAVPASPLFLPFSTPQSGHERGKKDHGMHSQQQQTALPLTVVGRRAGEQHKKPALARRRRDNVYANVRKLGCQQLVVRVAERVVV